MNRTLTTVELYGNNVSKELNSVIAQAVQVLQFLSASQPMCVPLQRNKALPSIHALLEADVARLWPASSASALHSAAPVWSAFFRHPRLFERHVLGIVAGLAGELSLAELL